MNPSLAAAPPFSPASRGRWRTAGIALFVFLMPITREFPIGVAVNASVADPVLLLLAAWMGWRLAQGRLRLPWLPLFLLNFLALLLSTVYNWQVSAENLGVKGMAVWLSKAPFLALYFYSVVNLVDTREDLLVLLKTWLWASVMVGCTGIYGSLAFQMTGVHNPFAHWYRAQGTFDDSNGYAMYMALSFYLSLLYRRLAGNPRWVWGVAAVQIAGFWFAGSRGGMLGFLASLTAYFTLVSSWRTKLRAAVMAGVAATPLLLVDDWNALLAATPITERLTTATVDLNNPEAAQRRGLWEQALDDFRRSPLLGVGRGNFGQLRPGGPTGYAHAHNTYLGILGDTGLLGFLTYALLVGSAAGPLLLQHPWFSSGAWWTPAAILLTALVQIAMSGMTVSIENHRALWMLLGMSECFRRLYLAGPFPAGGAT
jgi:O-antigen ligase